MVQSNNRIRTRSVKECYICGMQGELLYQDLKDRIFSAPGSWNFLKCPNFGCGLVWLDPMPLKEDIAVVYQNYYTHSDTTYTNSFLQRAYCSAREGYLAKTYGYKSEVIPIWKKLLGMLVYIHPGGRAQTDFSVMYLPIDAKGRLLDVGCGSGEFLERMEGMGYQVEGVDFDLAAVENARKKGMQVCAGTLEEQKYPDNHFDILTMSHVIEHVHDPLKQLQECHRILKPDGSLVIATPNNESWGHKIFKAHWRGLEPPRHLYLFSTKSLLRLVEYVGFKKLNIATSIHSAYALFVASEFIRRITNRKKGNPRSLAVRIGAKFLEYIESMILNFKPNIGEEIVFILKKH